MAETISSRDEKPSKKLPQTMVSAEFWWNKDDDIQAAMAVFASVMKLEHTQANTLRGALKHFRQFLGNNNYDLSGVFGEMASLDASTYGPTTWPIYNALESVIETQTSMIAGNKPRIAFVTDGGTWGQKRKAELLEQFNDGIYYETEIYDKAPMIFRDGAMLGTGVCYCYVDPDSGKLCSERVLQPEITLDEMEAQYGYPRQVYRKKLVNREVLMAMYPDKEQAIRNAMLGTTLGSRTGLADLLMVVEAWHLPSGEGAPDGRHVIAIPTDILVNEDWEYDWLPFVFFRYSKRPVGMWGRGVVEMAASMQDSLNNVDLNIDQAIEICGKPLVMAPKDSKVDWDKMSSGTGSVVTYDGGQAPVIMTASVVPAEQFQHRQTLKDDIYAIGGVSQLSASGVKPAGLNSGEAQRVYHDRQQLRFQTVQDAYDKFFMDYSKLCLRLVRAEFENDPKMFVRLPGQTFLQKIKWKDINLEEDDYVMKMYPVSALPKDPAGRMATLQEWLQGGLIDDDQFMLMSEIPDLKSVSNIRNAPIKHVEFVIDRILNHGDYIPPIEQDQKLDMQVTYVQAAATNARDEGAPEKRINMLLDWCDQAAGIIEAAKQQMQAAMAPPQPLGQPAKPPVSDLLPLPTAVGPAANSPAPNGVQ